MQGTLIDHKGEVVKDAVIRVRKITANASVESFETADQSEDGTGPYDVVEWITAHPDEEGNFVLEALDPEARYMFQIHRKGAEKNSLSEKKELAANVRVPDWEKPDEEDWEERDEEDGWDDDRDQEDDWDDDRDQKENWDDGRGGDANALPNIAAADLDDDYDDSEWFDIQEQEVMEQYAGNMIKPKKELEDKLITIRRYIW